MAEQIPTSFQEQFSIDFFKLFLDNNWDVNDQKYRKLLVDCFGKNGKFPFASNFPSTDKGLKDREEWRSSFDKQVLGLQLYMSSRRISNSGWKWSRGDGMMGFLNGIAQQRCGVSGSLDSWNPMDVVAVQSGMEDIIKAEIDRDVISGVDKDINKDLLNGIMIKYIKGNALMPISLKKINSNERGAFEESDNLKGRSAKRRHSYDFRYTPILCDLQWSTYKNEWNNAQEISYQMIQKPSVTKAGVTISVQARAFRAADSREKPQHSLAQQGAGAMLGKAPVAELDNFVSEYGVKKVLSPNDHPQIAKKGKKWTQTQKNYWIALQTKLAGLQINGNPINFNNPGSYGQGNKKNVVYKKNKDGKNTKEKLTGFAAALESACESDEKDLKTQNTGGSNGRSSGSRLTAKLWGIEWLWRYYQMSRKGVWDAFAYRMIKGAKKELYDSGPFIKILGEQGRTKSQQRLRMQQMIDDNPELTPIYDKNLENKKGVIPEGKKVPKNIVGYESKSKEWDDIVENIEWGEMWGQKKNTST
jgi:hypothetical protein